MATISIRHYHAAQKNLWDSFVDTTINSSFLFKRDFMEYHADRFDDYSLMFFKKSKLVAVLPAHRLDNKLFSHNGLSYGGMLYTNSLSLKVAVELYQALLVQLVAAGITRLSLKPIPSIYRSSLHDPESLIFNQLKAKNKSIQQLSVIERAHRLPVKSSRKAEILKAEKSNINYVESNNYKEFWNELLVPRLRHKHQTNPVHSLQEIEKLKARFPENIRLFLAYQQATPAAGICIFENEKVAHCQYIAVSDALSATGALDGLTHWLITEVFAEKSYFDFGTSSEHKGKQINHGLYFWKQSFGCISVSQEVYQIKTANHQTLSDLWT
ncbi:MAG: GNAT family N-acetyltransferase [Flavobacteriaceae bacterium]|nr:GNAT family N-acetyltransferase [Flavobacteriaceae bacterium]